MERDLLPLLESASRDRWEDLSKGILALAVADIVKAIADEVEAMLSPWLRCVSNESQLCVRVQ